uniref:DDE Tnp4 domain-containing protein n=1 Tax=Nothobranchius furzeri TaxID=105023 RepID=A0A8C6LXM2_NOTFU
SKDEVMSLCEISLLILLHKKTREWVHPILKTRERNGEYHHLMRDLKDDPDKFRTYFRLSPELFAHLLTLVTPKIEKIHTNMREPISPEERLAICLSTILNYRMIKFSFYFLQPGTPPLLVSTTMWGTQQFVSKAIWDVLQPEYKPEPTMEDWNAIEEGFRERWNFPNCIGALDGKHVVLQAPPSSGSKYYNYKGSHSIVLLAVVDAHYMFRVIDAGGYGRNSDGGILSESPLGKHLKAGTLSIPEDTTLQGSEHLGPMPHVLVADEAFSLQRHIMTPYPGKNLERNNRCYNYRLSRARRIVENAFGILSTQWRVYRRVLGICPKKADRIVKATCVLQNYMRKNGEVDRAIPQASLTDNMTTNDGLQPIPHTGSNNSSRETYKIRDKFCDYFSSPGSMTLFEILMTTCPLFSEHFHFSF